MATETNLARALDEARRQPQLRAFVETIEGQNEQFGEVAAELRERGDRNLQISRDWMEELEEACRPQPEATAHPSRLGARC